jgi:hypothetical protein
MSPVSPAPYFTLRWCLIGPTHSSFPIQEWHRAPCQAGRLLMQRPACSGVTRHHTSVLETRRGSMRATGLTNTRCCSWVQAVVRAERLRRREVRRMSGPLETFSPEVGFWHDSLRLQCDPTACNSSCSGHNSHDRLTRGHHERTYERIYTSECRNDACHLREQVTAEMEGSDASANPSPRVNSSSSQPPADASAAVGASRRASSETPYVPKRSSSTGAVGKAASAFSAFAAAADEPEAAGSSPTVRRLSGYSGIITQQSSPLLGLSRAASSGDTMPARRSPLCHVT